MINNITRKILFEIEKAHSRAAKEKIINIYIAKGNSIISDTATCYFWLDEINNEYTYNVHNHGHGDLGGIY